MEKIEREKRIDEIRLLAKGYGWTEVQFDEKYSFIAFRRKGVRMNVWYECMTVGTQLHHPIKGNTRMVRKKVDMELFEKICDHPRVHSENGYILKKSASWGKRIPKLNEHETNRITK